ncbi:MAG: alanine racemase [Bryobacteraceae bacterium]|nr:alanine racemase [Bryobacteraceae bacterium]
MTLHDLDTPALLIDLDIMERNLARVADYAHQHQLRLRPHTKTHKIPALGQRQLALGAVGLTVAKVSEAEVMLAAASPDLLIAYPTFGAAKLARVMEVARHTRVTMSLDSLDVARPLSAAAQAAGLTIGVLAEFDAGMGRVGVDGGEPLLALVQGLEQLPGITFEGLAFYPGQIKMMDQEGAAELRRVSERVAAAIGTLARHGIACPVVSAGSTPTWMHTHEVTGVNEMRPGTYIFNDRNTVNSGACGWQDCAASILTTVVSTARPHQMILDGGSKTFSSDRLANSSEVTFGKLVEEPAALFHKMNEEHGFVDLTHATRQFRVGERVRVIPNHVCVAMNLHEQVYGMRGETVESVWQVAGRGKLQ